MEVSYIMRANTSIEIDGRASVGARLDQNGRVPVRHEGEREAESGHHLCENFVQSEIHLCLEYAG